MGRTADLVADNCTDQAMTGIDNRLFIEGTSVVKATIGTKVYCNWQITAPFGNDS